MTDANGGPSGRKPLTVYAVLDRKDGAKPYWMKIGAAFTNRDGSLSVVLDAFPASTNRLQIREQRFPAVWINWFVLSSKTPVFPATY